MPGLTNPKPAAGRVLVKKTDTGSDSMGLGGSDDSGGTKTGVIKGHGGAALDFDGKKRKADIQVVVGDTIVWKWSEGEIKIGDEALEIVRLNSILAKATPEK